MNTELVSIVATDRLLLPGLFYAPPDKKTSAAAIWLHGMGDNGIFYNPLRLNALATSLINRGIALLAFNNRGAHNAKTLRIDDDTLPQGERHYQGGTHFERIADCVADIDGAVEFLQTRQFSELYLIGHSTGANKICVYDTLAPSNPFAKYVLAGPGDDTGLFYSDLGPRRFHLSLQLAQKLITSGKPLHIMPRYSGMHPFSAQATYDILNPNGNYNTFPYYEATGQRLGKKPLFAEYRKVERPHLVVFGAEDEYTYTAGDTAGALELFRQHIHPAARTQSAFMSIAGTDHGFHGQEKQFAETVAEWLKGVKP